MPSRISRSVRRSQSPVRSPVSSPRRAPVSNRVRITARVAPILEAASAAGGEQGSNILGRQHVRWGWCRPRLVRAVEWVGAIGFVGPPGEERSKVPPAERHGRRSQPGVLQMVEVRVYLVASHLLNRLRLTPLRPVPKLVERAAVECDRGLRSSTPTKAAGEVGEPEIPRIPRCIRRFANRESLAVGPLCKVISRRGRRQSPW